MFRVELKIMPRKGILNPQSAAVTNGLKALGYNEVLDFEMGKFMEFNLNAENYDQAVVAVEEMSKRLLANPIIEDYSYQILEIEGE